MSQNQWGKYDRANNSPIWASQQVGTQVAGTGTANSVNQAKLYQNTTADAYQAGMTIGVYGVSPAELDTATVGGVQSVTVTAAGSGFTVRPTVAFSGGGADVTSNATATATAKVVAVALGGGTANGGQDYAAGDVVTVAGGTSSVAAKINVLTVNATGGVLTVSINAAGSYTTLPTLSNNAPTGGNGTNLKVNLTYGLNTVTVTANGVGYSSAPTVTIGGTGGSGATATAALRTEERKVRSAGWVLRREQTATGRVQYETLVAMKSIVANAASTDADTGDDDTKFPNS